jgi:outer membrane lipoprotein SlyB
LRSDLLQAKYDDDARTPAKDKNGRWKSMLLNMAYSLGEQARAVSEGAARSGRPVDEYGIASIVGGGIGGAAAGGFRPSPDEERSRQGRMKKMADLITAARTQEAHKARIKHQKNEDEVKRAELGIRSRQTDAKALKDEQGSVLAILRLRKGQKFDPSKPGDAALLARAERARISIDPAGWNNAAGNLASIELIDPDNQTQKRRIFVNKVTGEQTDVGQSNYAAPVHPDTEMTSNQEGVNADRETRGREIEQLRRIKGAQDELERRSGTSGLRHMKL